MIERRADTQLPQVRFPGASRDFSPIVNCQCRLSYVCPYTPCAIACISICAHVKHPVVHVRVRWIMETLKHPPYTVGWVARLCRNWLPWKKATRISRGNQSHWDNTVVKSKEKVKSTQTTGTCPGLAQGVGLHFIAH